MTALIVLMIGELEVGGTQRHMLEIAKRFDRARFDVEVWVLSRSLALADEFRSAGIPVRVVDRSFRLDFRTVFELARLFKQHRASAVITYGITADAWGRVSARLARVPAVVSSVRTSREESRMLDVLNGCLRPFADHFIANSATVVEYVASFGVTRARITLIENGVDTARFDIQETREDTRSSLGISSDAFVLGIVSRLSQEKNVDGFLQAAHAFSAHCPRAEFVIVGDGPERLRLQAAALGAGIGDRTHWLGIRQDVPRIVKTMDIALLTSWREGMANALLEYMAAGLPIVASDVGGNACVLRHGDTGFLFPPGDTAKCVQLLTVLYADSDLRRSLGNSARRDVLLRFSMEAQVKQTEQLMLRLLRKRGIHPGDLNAQEELNATGCSLSK